MANKYQYAVYSASGDYEVTVYSCLQLGEIFRDPKETVQHHIGAKKIGESLAYKGKFIKKEAFVYSKEFYRNIKYYDVCDNNTELLVKRCRTLKEVSKFFGVSNGVMYPKIVGFREGRIVNYEACYIEFVLENTKIIKK